MADNVQKKLLIALMGEFQVLEEAINQLYTGYWIDEAVGAQLDVLGKIVGQARQGFSDADYRRLIRARISVNRSKGTIEDILKVAPLVVDDEDVYYQVDDQGVATVVLRLLDKEVPDDVAQLLLPFLRKTVSGGVRIILEWSSSPPGDWLIWDDTDWDDYEWVAGED